MGSMPHRVRRPFCLTRGILSLLFFLSQRILADKHGLESWVRVVIEVHFDTVESRFLKSVNLFL
jgi:hypothetical protein